VVTSYLTFRFQKLGPIAEGLPVIVVRNGRVQRQRSELDRQQQTQEESPAA